MDYEGMDMKVDNPTMVPTPKDQDKLIKEHEEVKKNKKDEVTML